MKPALYLIPVIVVTVFFLIRAELLNNRRQVFFFKPLSTLLVITMAALSWLQPVYNATFSSFILLGLIFSFGGDVALMFQDNPKAFRAGLILFLLGHISYTIIFSLYSSFTILDVLSAGILLAVGVVFYQLIKHNLGPMKMPVILYMVIISLMVNRAVATMFCPDVGTRAMQMIIAGAILFYVSDVILAANRFWRPWRYHRFSLAFYYAGQLLIALSTNYFKP